MAENKTEQTSENEASAQTEASMKEGSDKAAAPKSAGKQTVTLATGRGGVLGVKAGMTQVYGENGELLAVTVIDLKSNVITQVKTAANDGYDAVQVGLVEKAAKKATRPEQGHAKKAGASGFHHYQEIRLPDGAKIDGLTAGNLLSAEFVKAGEMVDITAISKGKGFQGAMKRHNFGGLPASHGVSVSHRAPGSIGNRADPSKVFKNKKMAGHMGHEKITIQNVKVIRVDLDNQLMLVHGSVPGPRSGVVTIRKAVKSIGAQA